MQAEALQCFSLMMHGPINLKKKNFENFTADDPQVLCFYILSYSFLRAFAKLRKVTIRFVMFVCLSVRPSAGTTRLHWMDFHENFIFEYFSKLSRKFKLHSNLLRITSNLHENQYTFLILPRSVHFRMRNVSDKYFTGNQQTHFRFSNIFSFENRRLTR